MYEEEDCPVNLLLYLYEVKVQHLLVRMVDYLRMNFVPLIGEQLRIKRNVRSGAVVGDRHL